MHARRAGAVTVARLLEQYETNRFVAPSPADPRLLAEFDRLAWSLLPDGYAPLELAPLCPLGTISAVAGVSQNRVVPTARNTEVVADSSNVLALECAIRRRRLRQDASRRLEPVLLAASQRLVRAQLFTGPRVWAHFKVLVLCAAGREEGSARFEVKQLAVQIGFYLRLLRETGRIGRPLSAPRVAVTDFTDGRLTKILEEEVLRPLSDGFPEATCHLDPQRSAGRGYYAGACFKVFATDAAAVELELADGGFTDWTRRLLSDRKERFVISGFGVERVCAG